MRAVIELSTDEVKKRLTIIRKDMLVAHHLLSRIIVGGHAVASLRLSSPYNPIAPLPSTRRTSSAASANIHLLNVRIFGSDAVALGQTIQ
jgi:hypothetical protein